MPLEQRDDEVDSSRDRGCFHAPLIGDSVLVEPFDRRRIEWSGSHTAERFDLLRLRIVDQDRHLAADREQAVIGHSQGQDRRRSCVARLATLFENAHSGGH